MFVCFDAKLNDFKIGQLLDNGREQKTIVWKDFFPSFVESELWLTDHAEVSYYFVYSKIKLKEKKSQSESLQVQIFQTIFINAINSSSKNIPFN